MVLGMGEINRFLEQWEMGVPGLCGRIILAPTPRKRGRRYTLWLLTQGWTASATAGALERNPHTIGPSASSEVDCRFRRGWPGGLDLRAVRWWFPPPPSKRRS